MLRRAKCATNLWFWCLYVLTVKIKIFIVTGNGNTHFDLRSCPASMKSGHKYLSLNNSFSRFKIFILFLLQRIQNLFVISLKLRFFLVICNYFWNYKYYILFLYEFQWLIVEILSFLDCCGLFILSLISLFAFTNNTYFRPISIFLSSVRGLGGNYLLCCLGCHC